MRCTRVRFNFELKNPLSGVCEYELESLHLSVALVELLD